MREAVNPLEGIRRPQISKEDKKARKDRKNFFEEDEATEVIETLVKSDTHWRLYFLGAIIGGFRRGELIALDEDDCDFVNNRLRIDESISHTDKGRADITDTKNEASDNYVDMPQWYMEHLVAHVKVMRKLCFEAKAAGTWKGGDRNFVFHAGTGKPYYHTIWCERNGFRNVSLQGLRHTNATYLLGQGASSTSVETLDISGNHRHVCSLHQEIES